MRTRIRLAIQNEGFGGMLVERLKLAEVDETFIRAQMMSRSVLASPFSVCHPSFYS
jgi:hypothetical protein